MLLDCVHDKSRLLLRWLVLFVAAVVGVVGLGLCVGITGVGIAAADGGVSVCA